MPEADEAARTAADGSMSVKKVEMYSSRRCCRKARADSRVKLLPYS